MSAVDRVLSHFKNVKSNGDGWQATCPAHDDQTPSLSIHRGRDGRVLLKCFAGCEPSAIVAAAGLEMSNLFDDTVTSGNGNGTRPHIAAEYRYVDEEGMHLFDVLRYEPKAFKQRAASGQWKMDGVRRVPYRLPQLRAGVDAARHVLIVEGEKDVDALVGLGFVATTNAGGAGKWRNEYAEHFRGAHVAILPDNDDPGRAHARDIATNLLGVAADVRIVDLPGVPLKGDASDWLGAGGAADELKALVRGAPVLTAAPTTVAVQQEIDSDSDLDLGVLRTTPHLEDAALYGPIGELVRIESPYTEAHAAGILVALIVGVGAMIGRTAFFYLGGAEHHTNLFAMLVGSTGDGRKGTGQAIARRLLRSIDPMFMTTNTAVGLSSGEGIIYRLSDGPPAKDGSAPPAKDKRLLISESEMSSPFRRMAREGNSLSPVLRQAWDGDALGTLTKGTTGADAGGLHASDHHVALMGQINPTELQKYLGEVELVNGFANRFLFCHVERVRICPDDERPDDREIAPHIAALAKAVQNRASREIRLHHDARDLWRGEMYADLTAGAPGKLGPLITRGAPIVRRLAAIYALADGTTDVGVVHLRAARALWQYSRDSLRFIYGEMMFSPIAVKMLNAITASGAAGLDLTELRAASATKNLPAADRRRALDELLMAGVVKPETEQTSGRSRTRLRLTRFALPTGSSGKEIRAARAISDGASGLNAPTALKALLPEDPVADVESALWSLMSQPVEQHATAPHATNPNSHNQPPQPTRTMRVTI